MFIASVVTACATSQGGLPSAGNALTRRTCLAAGHSQFCWEPRYMHNGYSTFWRKQRPYKLSAGAVEPISEPLVVHLRCGDILVRRHKSYALPCLSCLRGLHLPNTATLVVGGHGGTPESEARCGALAAFYARFAETRLNSTWSVTFSVNAERDWLRLRNARRVIALIASSFVFSARVGSLDNLTMFSPPVKRATWFESLFSRRQHEGGTLKGGVDGGTWFQSCNTVQSARWDSSLKNKLASC